MKWKTLLIIVILVIITLPSINAQFQRLELNTKDDPKKAPTGLPFEVVLFCFGKITNLREYGHGYCFYYTFKAIDVICIRSTDDHPIPFFHRFNNREYLGMPYPRGMITKNFIFAI